MPLDNSDEQQVRCWHCGSNFSIGKDLEEAWQAVCNQRECPHCKGQNYIGVEEDPDSYWFIAEKPE